VLRATERLINELKAEGASVRLVAVGKKAAPYFRFRGIEAEAAFQGFADKPDFLDAREVATAAAAPFLAGEAEKVMLVSMRFVSAGNQMVESRRLLPLTDPNAGDEQEEGESTSHELEGYTEFEPEAEELLGRLAPAALESEIFRALLEGAASFHSSQQRAMAAATENADELILTLTRVMNRARQESITTEIMEIVGGAEALRQ